MARFGTGTASNQRRFITGQLAKAERELKTAEETLRRFQERNRAILLGDMANSMRLPGAQVPKVGLELGRLMHVFVIAGERPRVQSDEQSLATRALREMLSSGELHKLVTITVAGRPKAVLIEQPGPISYCDTTTLTRLDGEDANRCLLLATDESAEQTRNIKLAIAAAAETGSADSAPIIARHHALQRMLKRVEVRVPFATQLAEAMPDERNEARRAIGHIISLIRAIALLHQRQRAGRPVEHGDIIQATIEDYVIARHLF